MDPAEEAVEATVEGTVVEGAPSAPSAEAISIQQMPIGGEDDDDDDDDGEDGPPRKKRGGHGRRKIEIEYIEDKIRRHITFSKRKAGISKKAYELSRLTGAQVCALTCSHTCPPPFPPVRSWHRHASFHRCLDPAKRCVIAPH